MNRKTGITMAMLVVIVAVLAILTTVTVTAISNSYNNAKLSTWVAEIGIIQDIMKEHKDNYAAVLMDTTYIDVSGIDAEIKAEQFSNEVITSNKIYLKEINLAAIGIDNALYGNHKTELDVYAYSETTGKVYYLKGMDNRVNVFYTLTQDLKNRYGDNLTVSNLSLISFEQSEIEPTMNAVKVTVKVPKTYTAVSITTTNSSITVGSRVTEADKYTYLVNGNGIKGNYTITVTYTENGTSKMITHEVKNFQTPLGELITSAADYGKTIDYVSDNGVTGWKIFYHTEEYVYLIASEGIAYGKVPTILKTTAGATIASTTITLSDNTQRTIGQVYWVSGSAPTSSVTVQNPTMWMANWGDYKTNVNGRCISYFLDETYWKGFKNTKTRYKDYVEGVIGTPTAEMFVASWNAKRAAETNTDKVKLTLTNGTTGYNINSSIVTTDTLYIWSTVSNSGVWLASPAYYDSSMLLTVRPSGIVDGSGYAVKNYSVRPVVCLSTNIPAKVGTTTDYSLIK